jgi:hypothetical protein
MSPPCQCLALVIGVVLGLRPAHGPGQGAPAKAEGKAPLPGNAPTATEHAPCGRSTGTRGHGAEQATPRQDATAPPRCCVRPQFTSLEVPHDP